MNTTELMGKMDMLPCRKKVLVRVDFNVPFDEGQIRDDTRLRQVIPTLQKLRARENQCLLITHLGRPGGKPSEKDSVRVLLPTLRLLLQDTVTFVSDLHAAPSLDPSIPFVLFENLRFYPGEEANAPDFSESLAKWGNFYINEAFSVSHRAHASVVGLPKRLPHMPGPLFFEEWMTLKRLLQSPTPPSMALTGGAKISTKFKLLKNLQKSIDVLAVGGGIANTLLASQGVEMGESLYEASMIQEAQELLKASARLGKKLLLPLDARCRKKDGGVETFPVKRIPADCRIFDIGPDTCQLFSEYIQRAGTIFWNGPVGRFEEPPFQEGTVSLLHTIAQNTQHRGLVSIVGGGDSVAALNAAKLPPENSVTYLSTSGGALLEFLQGDPLPGVNALKDSLEKFSHPLLS